MKKSVILIFMAFIIWSCEQTESISENNTYGITNKVILSNIKDGIHTPTGLIAGQGLESVLRHCVSCHSSKLISQNRATADGWRAMIQWMYDTQNLPELGDQEGIIISYLAEHYAPGISGRRKNLDIKKWYPLQE